MRARPAVVVIGNGGHAKVVLDILLHRNEYEVAGCTGESGSTGELLGVPVLGGDEVFPELHRRGVRHAFVALGDNRLRQRKAREALAAGFEQVRAVSLQAVIGREVSIGPGVAIMPGAVVNAASRIGEGAIINTGATIDHDCMIGAFAHVAPGTNLAGCVTIGEGAFLGIGVRVIPRVTIGEWAVLGAGAVAIRDIPAGCTAVGVPATVR